MMERMNLVEKVGTGILRIQDGMKAYELSEPVIEADEQWFSITFERDVQRFSQWGEPLNQPLKSAQLQRKISTGFRGGNCF
ncbi:MAG: hypothetical protein GY940_02365 [bacterium]|nr:hypothetical protein [bacterium]